MIAGIEAKNDTEDLSGDKAFLDDVDVSRWVTYPRISSSTRTEQRDELLRDIGIGTGVWDRSFTVPYRNGQIDRATLNVHRRKIGIALQKFRQRRGWSISG